MFGLVADKVVSSRLIRVQFVQVMRAEAAQLRRLERAHGVDLTAYAHHGPAAGRAAAPDPRREYIGLAVAAALRSLRLPYNAEPGVGVVVCDADDITNWAQRRCDCPSSPSSSAN